MKKVFAILAIAGILAACNNEGTTEATVDSAAAKVDSTVEAAKDTIKATTDSAAAKIDSAAKAVVDSVAKH